MIYDLKYENNPNCDGRVFIFTESIGRGVTAAGTFTITGAGSVNEITPGTVMIRKGIHVSDLKMVDGKLVLEPKASCTNFPTGELYQNPTDCNKELTFRNGVLVEDIDTEILGVEAGF